MTFISYAQNLEDVMIWRALSHLDKGFYVDVGANDPEIDSVTKAFYDRGWSGINIEPVTEHYNDLVNARPKDINLQCVASSKLGELDIWESNIRGWATISDEVSAQHEINGFTGVKKRVLAIPLLDICLQHAKQEIHFLKIDVEGAESDVVDGMDFSIVRPWIIVIESTVPNTLEPNYDIWEKKITGADYLFAYTDGINRFYIAKEHSNLLKSLSHPPNVFDNFMFVQQQKSELRAQNSELRAQNSEDRAILADKRATESSEKYNSIIASQSWRITAPLRGAVNLSRWLLSGINAWVKFKPGSRPRRILRGLIIRLRDWVVQQPNLKSRVIYVLQYFPRIKRFLKRFQNAGGDFTMQISNTGGLDINRTSWKNKDREYYSPRAIEIYNKLKLLKTQQRKGDN